jgi:hypothetical protein
MRLYHSLTSLKIKRSFVNQFSGGWKISRLQRPTECVECLPQLGTCNQGFPR